VRKSRRFRENSFHPPDAPRKRTRVNTRPFTRYRSNALLSCAAPSRQRPQLRGTPVEWLRAAEAQLQSLCVRNSSTVLLCSHFRCLLHPFIRYAKPENFTTVSYTSRWKIYVEPHPGMGRLLQRPKWIFRICEWWTLQYLSYYEVGCG